MAKRKLSGGKRNGSLNQKRRSSKKRNADEKKNRKTEFLLKLPEWALHEILRFAEPSKGPWIASSVLCQLSKEWSLKPILKDGRALAKDEMIYQAFGKNKEEERLVNIGWIDELLHTSRLGSRCLVAVRLDNSLVQGSLEPFSSATSLSYLSLANCDEITSDIAPLAQLYDLKFLNLHGCYRIAGDLMSLEKLVLLKHLNLNFCSKLKGNIQFLANAKKLQTVYLDWCHSLSGNLFQAFGRDPHFNVQHHLSNIDTTARRYLHLLDLAPPPVGPPLRHISILNTRISGASAFRQYHPECYIYDS
mmetsp:Transcript_8514/g.13052  ORF Transcript_8514/g.13052 Transcript_8514/m.13052 type:complete len:304 (-) Transcript_8514:128-1039(-)